MSVLSEACETVGACFQVAEVSGRPTARRTAARALLEAIDDCLNLLEERHVKGGCIGRQRACNTLVADLAAAVGANPPEAVWAARTSYALHAALLDWQSSILDQVVPDRRSRFPDLEADRDDWPVPRLRRARRSVRGRRPARASLAGAA